MEPQRTPGKAEGTEEDAEIALQGNQQQRQQGAEAARRREEAARAEEPGHTAGKAEGEDSDATPNRKPK